MAVIWAIGAGIGLSVLAGSRSFIPLAIFVLFARLGWIWGFRIEGTPFDFMLSNGAVVVIVALVVFEILLTRLPALIKISTFLRLPIAVIAGALLLAATMSAEISNPARFLGIPGGVLLALLGFYVHQGLVFAGEGADPGPALDSALIVLAILMMVVPPAGYAVVLVAAWLAWRVRRLKRLKYKGLRVLA